MRRIRSPEETKKRRSEGTKVKIFLKCRSLRYKAGFLPREGGHGKPLHGRAGGRGRRERRNALRGKEGSTDKLPRPRRQTKERVRCKPAAGMARAAAASLAGSAYCRRCALRAEERRREARREKNREGGTRRARGRLIDRMGCCLGTALTQRERRGRDVPTQKENEWCEGIKAA